MNELINPPYEVYHRGDSEELPLPIETKALWFTDGLPADLAALALYVAVTRLAPPGHYSVRTRILSGVVPRSKRSRRERST